MLNNPVFRHILLPMIFMNLTVTGCGEEATEDHPDAGDTNDAGPDAGTSESCLACHLDKDMLLASLEADPLPVDDAGVEESTGEG